MKKSILILGLIILSTIINSSSAFAQKFIEYKVNGIQFKAADDQVSSFTAFRSDYNEDETQKNICKYMLGEVGGIYGHDFTVELTINFDSNSKVQLQDYPLGGSIAFYETRPIATIEAIKRLKDDKFEFYKSENNSLGNITITKVEGDWIEGTFEGDLTPQYPLNKKDLLKVTEGKFRFPIELLE